MTNKKASDQYDLNFILDQVAQRGKVENVLMVVKLEGSDALNVAMPKQLNNINNEDLLFIFDAKASINQLLGALSGGDREGATLN